MVKLLALDVKNAKNIAFFKCYFFLAKMCFNNK